MTTRIVPFDGSLPAYRRRVALLKEAQPDEPWSVEGERAADEEVTARSEPPGAFFAEADGEPVGFALFRLDREDDAPGRRRLWLAVAHGARRRGVGSALLAAAGEAAAVGGAKEFLASTSLAEPDGLAFARRHGFREVRGEVELILDLAAGRGTPASTGGPPGLQVQFLASLAGSHPNWHQRYHTLYATLATGVMWASRSADPAGDHFRRFHLEAPGFLAEGTAVAVLDGKWVGLCELWGSGEDRETAYQELTAVLPGWRGRGIGGALVGAVAGAAARLGFRRLFTSTGTENREMQGLARRLGFVTGARWSYLVGPVP